MINCEKIFEILNQNYILCVQRDACAVADASTHCMPNHLFQPGPTSSMVDISISA